MSLRDRQDALSEAARRGGKGRKRAESDLSTRGTHDYKIGQKIGQKGMGERKKEGDNSDVMAINKRPSEGAYGSKSFNSAIPRPS